MLKRLLSRLNQNAWRLLLDEQSVRVQSWSPDGWQEEGSVAVPPIMNSAATPSGQDGIPGIWRQLRDHLPPASPLQLVIAHETAETQVMVWPKLQRREWAPFLQQRFSRQLMAGELVAVGATATPRSSPNGYQGGIGGGQPATGGRDVWLLRGLGYLPELLDLLQGDGHRLSKVMLAGRDDGASIPLWLPLTAIWQRLSQQWLWLRRCQWVSGAAAVAVTILLLLDGVQLRQEAMAMQVKAVTTQQSVQQLAGQMPMPLADSHHWQLADRWWQQQVANHPSLFGWLSRVSAVWPSALMADKLSWQAGRSKPEQWWQPSHAALTKTSQPELQIQVPATLAEDPTVANIIALLPSQLAESAESPESSESSGDHAGQPADKAASMTASWQTAANGAQILTLQPANQAANQASKDSGKAGANE
jgi:hypothetical protein